VSLPFFLAALEMETPKERNDIETMIFQHIDPICPLVQKQVYAFVQAFWQVRDSSTNFFWLDLVPQLPPLYMMPT
jgi:hypothetical protein